MTALRELREAWVEVDRLCQAGKGLARVSGPRPELARRLAHVRMIPMSLSNRSAERAKYGYLLQLAREQVQALESDDLFAFDRILAAKRTLIESLVDGRTLVASDPVLQKQVTLIQEIDATAQRLLYRQGGQIMREMAELQQFKKARRAYGLRPAAPFPRRTRPSSWTVFRDRVPCTRLSLLGERVFLCRERTAAMKLPTVKKATKDFEAWLGERTTLVEADLEFKHQTMAQDAFSFLRGTFYRWAQVWPKACEALSQTPPVLAVGDLHVENFGTWRDTDGRLVWGVNDFDEAYSMPYTNDLVRLATSALLAAQEGQLSLKSGGGLRGDPRRVRRGPGGGGPAVRAGGASRLAAPDGPRRAERPVTFWQKMDKLPELKDGLPASARGGDGVAAAGADSRTTGWRGAGPASGAWDMSASSPSPTGAAGRSRGRRRRWSPRATSGRLARTRGRLRFCTRPS